LRKSTFYRCVDNGDGIKAVRTVGFSEGDIGLHEETHQYSGVNF